MSRDAIKVSVSRRYLTELQSFLLMAPIALKIKRRNNLTPCYHVSRRYLTELQSFLLMAPIALKIKKVKS